MSAGFCNATDIKTFRIFSVQIADSPTIGPGPVPSERDLSGFKMKDINPPPGPSEEIHNAGKNL
jgi:hypothetical protein